MSNSRISRISPPVWHKLVPGDICEQARLERLCRLGPFYRGSGRPGRLADPVWNSALYPDGHTAAPGPAPYCLSHRLGRSVRPDGHWRGPGISQCLLPLPHPGSGFVSSPAGGQLLLASAFFSLRAYGLSLVWLALLWVLIWVMLAAFRRVDPLAAWLQLPYLLWVSFALYLNWGVWQLNS